MYFSALQTKKILAINCKVKENGLHVELLVIDRHDLSGQAITLYASLPEERNLGSITVKMPYSSGLQKHQVLELCQ
jgi:hypothetical protein